MSAAVFTIGLATVMLLVPYPVLLALPVLAGVVRGAWWMTDKIPVPGDGGSPTFRCLLACTVGAAAASPVVWFAVDDRPWMAAEEFTIGAEVIVGYPIADGDWTTVLRGDNRTILRVRSIEITDRATCDVHQPTSLPSIAQVWPAMTIPLRTASAPSQGASKDEDQRRTRSVIQPARTSLPVPPRHEADIPVDRGPG